MTLNIMDASNQWSTRPDDERFSNLAEMKAACHAYAADAAEGEEQIHSLRIEAGPGNELLVSATEDGPRAKIGHFAFGQFCSRVQVQSPDGGMVSAPASYLRALPADFAAVNLNYAMSKTPDSTVKCLYHNMSQMGNGKLLMRAATSEKYGRVWNYQICEWLESLPNGWRVPPARPARAGQAGTRIATQEDCLRDQWSLSIKPGDTIAPAGLYASDHDCFAFLVNEDSSIEANGEHLSRGFIIKNSEVGASGLNLTVFWYEHICGNHIIWNVASQQSYNLRHIGDLVGQKGIAAVREIQKLAQASTTGDRARILSAQSFSLGDKKEEVIENVYQKNIAPKATITKAYEEAEKFSSVHGSPRSAWGLAAGLTRLSQNLRHADQREAMDKTATRVLNLVK